MTHVGVTQLRASLSAYLTRIETGEVVTITRYGRPIAQLMPVYRAPDDSRAYLADLEREGLVRMGTGEIPDEFWELDRPEDPEGRALAYLLEERENGW